MNHQSMMELTLIVCLLAGGYFLLLHTVLGKAEDSGRRFALTVVLLLIYGVVGGMLALLLTRIGGGRTYALMAVLMLMVMVLAAWIYMELKFHWHQINKSVLVIFIVYFLAVGYVTLFSREERNRNEIIIGFDSLLKAFRQGSAASMRHFLLNIALFVPLGFLLTMLCEDRSIAWLAALGFGLLLTSMVESAQLLFRLGQCDVQDLAANAGGMMIGCFASLLFTHFHRR